MSKEDIMKYWNELNKMYGTDIEFPEDLDLSDHSAEIKARVACGETIDSAIQSTFNF